MQTNRLPHFDDSVNLTGCCARFNPEGWDGAQLHFEARPFVRATTRSLAHIPLDMGRVFTRVLGHIAAAGAQDPHQVLVLSRELSAFRAEHLFAVTKPVEAEEMTTLSGDFTTRLFEGPYAQVRNWHRMLEEDALANGTPAKAIWFYYTTCPACAKAYGRNPVVGVTQSWGE
jgi:hypothetical protein